MPLLVDDEEDVAVESGPHEPNTGLEWPELGKLVIKSRRCEFSKIGDLSIRQLRSETDHPIVLFDPD